MTEELLFHNINIVYVTTLHERNDGLASIFNRFTILEGLGKLQQEYPHFAVRIDRPGMSWVTF